MVKTIQKGVVATPTQQRPTSSRAHLSRQVSAAAHDNRQPEQSSLTKEDDSKTEAITKTDVDVAATPQEPESAVSTDPFLLKVADTLLHILDKYEMSKVAKGELKEIANHINMEATKREKWLLEPKAQAKVSASDGKVQFRT